MTERHAGLAGFVPAVADWFADCFAAPTPVQVAAWQQIAAGRHTLIAAPTGSGKTLAAFLAVIDRLVRDGVAGCLPDAVRVVYVSPLKALSHDIERNLQQPLARITAALGAVVPELRVAVRTGDTPPHERAGVLRRPPHILVTTPESLYLLLTAAKGQRMLATVDTVIVDEIHAVVGDKRGAHLALSLERLEHAAGRQLHRIGLSATQTPIDEVARFLVGTAHVADDGTPDCAIVDAGLRRDYDLALELPDTPLTAVMSAEVWRELYDRIVALIEAHTTTLLFVNTRRTAERLAHGLAERLGSDVVAAHHGSLARERRLDAEMRLRNGQLKVVVATSSLELGIDIGAVDLVLQIGTPGAIAALIQRVGRSRHQVGGVPKGRLFPLSRDDLVECAALLAAVRQGKLDRLHLPTAPLDILAQQVVAHAAAADALVEDDLFALVRRAWPYRGLDRGAFDDVLRMLHDGFSTRRGRRGAYVLRDRVHGTLRARRAARLTALTCGGAIPDTFDFDVRLEADDTFLGSVNEDFAIESMPGDVFQLGATAWRIVRVERGVLRVVDAAGQPPSLPFWLGEAPGRSNELSQAVAELRAGVAAALGEPDHDAGGWLDAAVAYVCRAAALDEAAARQLVEYVAAGTRALGAVPTQQTLVLERFFDEAGDMHIVLHAPFGSRVNRAWGLALRKQFCRTFNFELQAAATEDAVMLSLGTVHSFDLAEVFRYLSASNVRDTLVQAMLDAAVFKVRWRWNASRSLAIQRQRKGKRTPPQIQRMDAEDLLTLVFPDQVACLENIQGDRQVPEHPLVAQTVHDCLTEAMDIVTLEDILARIAAGRIACKTADMVEPSPFALEIIAAKPYAFLDDAPLEERRAQAIRTRRWLDPAQADEIGRLDPQAITSVRAQAWPEVRDADELADALALAGALPAAEGYAAGWSAGFAELRRQGRATLVPIGAGLWVAAERLAQVLSVHPQTQPQPPLSLPPDLCVQLPAHAALVELVRARLELVGPTTATEVAAALAVAGTAVAAALAALEAEGFVLRGRFTPDAAGEQWCERRLLARIHRMTLAGARREIEPVATAEWLRFLLDWQRVTGSRGRGPEALAAVIEQLAGFAAPAAAWEGDLLSARVADYDPAWLDQLSLTGRVAWARLVPSGAATPVRATPIALIERAELELWRGAAVSMPNEPAATPVAANVYADLQAHGASFFDQVLQRTALLPAQVEDALGELVALGLATADGFAGLRTLLAPSDRRRRRGVAAIAAAGRWTALAVPTVPTESDLETLAWRLLRRWGVVGRRWLTRESLAVPWRELVRVYRRLEARGQIRGGWFVRASTGEQFALPEAVQHLREVRRREPNGLVVGICAADPINLLGIVTSDERVPATAFNRIVLRDGVPVAVRVGGDVRHLVDADDAERWRVERALVQQPLSPRLRAYLRRR